MQTIEINTHDQQQINNFIQFPFKLYQNDSYWVPPLHNEMKLAMNKNKHPFYQHSDTGFFMVSSENQIVGRIAIIDNRNYNNFHQSKTAFFYYLDMINDVQVSNALFSAAENWAKKRGLDTIIGARGLSRSSGIGVLVDGFDILPAMGIPYNFPYYANLIDSYGFRKETDYLSGYMDYSHQLPEKLYTIAEKVKQRGNFWVKTFINKSEMRKWITKVDEVNRKAFMNNPGYYPSTPEEFQMMANSMIQIADHRMIKLIMKGNEVAGFIISYPNVGRAIQKCKGRIWPLGWVYILHEMKKTKIVDLNGVGIIPEYHGLGANALLYTELEKSLRQFSFNHAELVQIDERNFKSKSDMENMGVTWYKTHRVFRLDIL